jgi:Uri superfamily endonuclease
MKGSYGLVLRQREAGDFPVGRLGRIHFAAGFYLYFGNAFNGLEARVGRHLRRDKKPHWHIDFITGVMPVERIWWTAGPQPRECAWTRLALEHHRAGAPARGFGSSDCPGCPSHLVYVPEPGVVAEIEELLRRASAGLFHVAGNMGKPGAHGPEAPPWKFSFHN